MGGAGIRWASGRSPFENDTSCSAQSSFLQHPSRLGEGDCRFGAGTNTFPSRERGLQGEERAGAITLEADLVPAAADGGRDITLEPLDSALINSCDHRSNSTLIRMLA